MFEIVIISGLVFAGFSFGKSKNKDNGIIIKPIGIICLDLAKMPVIKWAITNNGTIQNIAFRKCGDFRYPSTAKIQKIVKI